jgi:hypothetical protein
MPLRTDLEELVKDYLYPEEWFPADEAECCVTEMLNALKDHIGYDPETGEHFSGHDSKSN